MKRNALVFTIALLSFVLSLVIGYQQQSAIAEIAKNTSEPPVEARQTPEPPVQNSKSTIDKRKSEIEKTSPDANSLSPRISFEKTVCDLGDVGQGTKNPCEFKFTNTGQALLKIGKIKRTCGCTIFELDRKEYAPGQKGTIRVSYIAGKSTALRQKHIYVPSNDKDNPKVKLTIKARVVQLIEATPQRSAHDIRYIYPPLADAIRKIRV